MFQQGSRQTIVGHEGVQRKSRSNFTPCCKFFPSIAITAKHITYTLVDIQYSHHVLQHVLN